MNATEIALASSLAAVFLGGCSAHAAPALSPAPVPIALERAHAARAEAIFRGPASVVAAHTYRLAFEVPGRIANVNVDVGDRVRAGSVLARIDAADYRAQVAEAAARAAAAQAHARKVLAGSRPQERAAAQDEADSARARLAQAQAGLALAHANAERALRLFDQGAISAQAQDAAGAAQRDAQAQAAAAYAGLRGAQNQAALVDSGPRSEDRSAAVAEASAAGVARQLAQITLEKTVLRAPADAYVLQRSIEPGDEAAPGAIVLTLTDAAAPDVLVWVPESKGADIHVGTSALVRAGGERYAMHVTRIEPQADPLTRTVQVRLHGPNVHLRPGAVVMAEIGRRHVAGASVPIGAVLSASNGATSVAIYDPRSASIRARPVRVRASWGDSAIVMGVRPGELVVTGGQYQARAGQSVVVVSQEN